MSDYAILVGISRYPNPGFSDLEGPSNDVELFEAWLRSPEGGGITQDDHILKLVSPKPYPEPVQPDEAPPTFEEFKRLFRRFCKPFEQAPGRRLYLYFSGHGFSERQRAEPHAAIYTADAEDGWPENIPGTDYAQRAMRKGWFQEVVLVMDCCRDSEINRKVAKPNMDESFDEGAAAQGKFLAFYAAPFGGKAQERPIPEAGGAVHGLLTYALVEALSQAPHDAKGEITAYQLKSYLYAAWARRFGADAPDKPKIQLPDGEDLVFQGAPGVALATVARAAPQAPVDEFDSPIPLEQTRTHHEYHQHPVQDALAATLADDALRVEGGFFFCLRDAVEAHSDLKDDIRQAYARAYRGFRLLDQDGAVKFDYDSLELALNVHGRLLLRATHLPAGHYQLEWRPEQGPAMRMPIILRPGLTTQWYALVQGEAGAPARWRPDLGNLAIAFADKHGAKQLDNPLMLLAERARLALGRSGKLPDATLADDLARGASDNPMLGLLAAHLLLLEKAPRLDLIEQVLANTEAMLGGDFPDVIALGIKLAALRRRAGERRPGGPGGLMPVGFPPLLRRSWDYLLEASVGSPDLIPADSLAARVSPFLVNCGIWLAWRPQAHEGEGDSVAATPTLEQWTRQQPDIQRVLARGALLGMSLYRSTLPDLTDNTVPSLNLDRLARTLGAAPPGGDVTGDEAMHDPFEQARNLLEHLILLVPWDQVIRQIRRGEMDNAFLEGVTDLQRALLLSLRFAQQHFAEGGQFDRRFIEGMARSLAVPVSMLLDGLIALADRVVSHYVAEPDPDQAAPSLQAGAAES